MHGVVVDPLITNLMVFVLAIFVGYHVVWHVTPALHTPLMSVTNAISSVIIVGAILAAGSGVIDRGSILGAVAVALVAINTFGGFLVTERMLEMFKKKDTRGEQEVSLSPNVIALVYLVASVLFILALKGLSSPLSARRGNRFGIAGMTIAVVTTLAITGSIYLTIGALAVGGLVGWLVAKRVEMTQMPELVAAMHSLVGLAAVLIAIAVVNSPSSFGIDAIDSRGQPGRAVHRHVRRRDDVLGIRDCVRQARRARQDAPSLLERAGRVQGAARRQPAARASSWWGSASRSSWRRPARTGRRSS